MKVRLEVDGKVLEYERRPMRTERFRALCRLGMASILGAVFLTALKMVGVPALIAAGVLVFFYGIYRAIENA